MAYYPESERDSRAKLTSRVGRYMADLKLVERTGKRAAATNHAASLVTTFLERSRRLAEATHTIGSSAEEASGGVVVPFEGTAQTDSAEIAEIMAYSDETAA